jgi:hypothetical protein
MGALLIAAIVAVSGSAPVSRSLETPHYLQQRAYGGSRLDGVTQAPFRMYGIAVSPTFTDMGQDAIGFHIRDNPLHRTLGDTDLLRNVAEASGGVTGKADQYMRVIREKCPYPGPLGTGLYILPVCRLHKRISDVGLI